VGRRDGVVVRRREEMVVVVVVVEVWSMEMEMEMEMCKLAKPLVWDLGCFFSFFRFYNSMSRGCKCAGYK